MSSQDHTQVATHAPSVVQIDKSSMTLCVVAIVLAAMAVGASLFGAILIPEIVQSRAQSASAGAIENARIAEREARISTDQIQALRMELAKQGIHVRLDDH